MHFLMFCFIVCCRAVVLLRLCGCCLLFAPPYLQFFLSFKVNLSKLYAFLHVLFHCFMSCSSIAVVVWLLLLFAPHVSSSLPAFCRQRSDGLAFFPIDVDSNGCLLES